jgi:hypothetical protein
MYYNQTHMKSRLQVAFSVIVLFLAMGQAWAQPQGPCDIPQSTDNCENAPILCNFDEINGYCTSMSPVITGNGPSPLCSQGGAPHNVIWFAFYAGCTSLNITLIPTNCVAVGGQLGIQAAIYGYGGNGLCPNSNQQPAQEIACQSIPCFTGPWTLNAQGMTIGQIYYFMIDGCAGSYCDIEIVLNSPCGAPAIGPWPSPIQGPLNICTGGTGNYVIVEPVGGIEYYWYLDGSEIQAGPTNSIPITWTTAGTYQLCVDVSNQCVDVNENPPLTCININVYDVTPEDPDPVTICQGTTHPYNGQQYPEGTYEITLKSQPGNCDSIVTLEVIWDPHVDEDLGVIYLCPNDITVVGGVQWDYSNQGDNIYTIPKAEAPFCDSSIIFNITGLFVEVYIFPPDPLGCLFTQVTLDGQGTVTDPPVAIVSYQWFAYNGGVLGSPSDQPTMVVEEPGKYCLRVDVLAPDGSTSCWDSTCVTVTQLPIPNAQASANPQTLTCTNPQATLTGQTVTPNVQVQWFGPGGPYPFNQYVITTTLPGTYSFVVTDNTGCPATANVVVSSNQITPSAIADGGLITCANPTVNLTGSSLTPGATFAWKDAGGNVISNNPVTPAPGPGTFTLVVTNPANGCVDSATAIVTINQVLPIPTASTDTLTCNLPEPPLQGGSNVPGATYTWRFGGNIYASQADTVAAQSGSYTLTVFNPVNGCSKDTTIIVPENTVLPDAQAAGDSLDCVKTTATLVGSSATPGATFRWFDANNEIGNTPSINVTLPGIYTLLVTGLNGCTRTTTAEAILDAEIPDVFINPSDDTLNCTVTEIILAGSASMPVNYVWTNTGGVVIGNNANLTVNTPGTYTLTVTAGNGCTNQTTVFIPQDITPPVIDAVAGGEIDCISSGVNLSASSSTPGVVYQWFTSPGNSPLPPGPTPYVTSAGTFKLVVTAYNGCVDSAFAVVTASPDLPQNVNASNSGPINCTNPSVNININSSTPGVVYQWQGPGYSGTAASAPVTLPGTYNVTVTNPLNGCTQSTLTTVAIDTIRPALTPNGNLINCNNPNVAISVVSVPATGVTYQWANPSGVPSGNTASINVAVSGTWQVTVTNTTNGCSRSVNVLVTENTTAPTITIPAVAALTCSNPASTLINTPSTSVNYQWSGPGINAGNQNTANPNISLPGTYSVTITDPVNGCTGTASANVSEDRVDPVVTLSGGELDCNDPTITIIGSSNPATGISVQWLLNGSTIAGTGTSLSVNQSGTYTLAVTNNANGCTSQAQAVVTENFQNPNVSVTGGEVTCIAPTLSVVGTSSTPGVSYQWNGPGGFTANTAITQVTVPGPYVLTVRAPNGCTSQATATVTENKDLPTAVASTSNVIDCSNPTTTLSSAGSSSGAGFTYAWTGPSGGLVGTSATVSNVAITGVYTLTVTNTANGCSNNATIIVQDNQNLPTGLDVTLTDPRCFGRRDGSLLITGVTGGTPPFLYSLNGGPFTPNNQFSGLGDGNYTITVQDAAGCLYTAPSFNLTEPLELTVDLGEDFILQWGRDTFLFALISPPNAIIESIQWTPVGVDTTLNSREINIKPFNQTLYGVVVTDAAGCRAEDKVLVLVEKRRPVYIPNVFAPAGEQNTRFYIQTGDGIEEIEIFEVFNRWGERVFRRENFQPNDPSLGWDGNFRDRPANPEVFVYYAKIRFNDGITILYKGDVTLMR